MKQDPEKEKKKKSYREKNQEKMNRFNERQAKKNKRLAKKAQRTKDGKVKPSTFKRVKAKFKYGGTKRFDMGGVKDKSYK